ncbi:unnamed protein product [Alopecurus aequalis]
MSTAEPYFKELQHQFASTLGDVNRVSKRLLGAFVEATFTFTHQPLRPNEGNFSPVEEIGEIREILDIAGEIPADFPEGVYIRNGSNPLFGALHSSDSIFGKSHDIWIEGEGMLHALYFTKSSDDTWSISYTNRYVESDTYRIEKELKRPCFLPSTDGDPRAMLIAAALNTVIPGTGELVIFGFNVDRPFLTVGIVSADGMKLKRKVALDLDRCTYCHEIGVTTKYNIILDSPLTISKERMLRGAPLIEFEKDSYARIGVMPHYGDANSIIWFYVQPFCMMHLVNCFEEDDEVIVRGFHVPSSIIMGPTLINMMKETTNKGLNEEYCRLYEWRLNLTTRKIAGKYLTGTEVALEFPVINDKYVGLLNKYAYAQVGDSPASFAGGPGIVRPKFGGFAKILLDEREDVTKKEQLLCQRLMVRTKMMAG